jgi:hypothetical protein
MEIQVGDDASAEEADSSGASEFPQGRGGEGYGKDEHKLADALECASIKTIGRKRDRTGLGWIWVHACQKFISSG